jgi:hypothetical protein
MVALYFAYRALAALAIATPVSLLAGSAVGAYPRGDAVLFDPGALLLTELGRVTRLAAPALAAQLGVGVLLAAVLGLLPLAALIVALGRPGPLSAALVAGRVAAAVGPLALLWGIACVSQVSAAGLVLLAGGKLAGALGLAQPADDLAFLAVAAAALLAAFAVAVLHDLARVASVHEERRFYAAASRALSVAAAAPFSAVWACAWRATLALAAIACAAWLAHRIGSATSGRVALSFALHNAGIAAAAFLRASWLAAALRLLERVRDRG